MVGRAVDPQPAAHAALVRAGLPRASESSPEASDALKLQEGELFKAFKGSLKTSEAGELRYVAHLTSLKSLNISFSLLFLKDEVLLHVEAESSHGTVSSWGSVPRGSGDLRAVRL